MVLLICCVGMFSRFLHWNLCCIAFEFKVNFLFNVPLTLRWSRLVITVLANN